MASLIICLLAATTLATGLLGDHFYREVRRLERENAEHRRHDISLMTNQQIYEHLDRRQRMSDIAIPPTIHPSAEGGFHATDS